MMMRVRELGDEVHIDLDGVAGRQQRVLQALRECQREICGDAPAADLCDVNVRAGANAMRIRMKGRAGLRFEADSIYRCLREALLEPRLPAARPAP